MARTRHRKNYLPIWIDSAERYAHAVRTRWAHSEQSQAPDAVPLSLFVGGLGQRLEIAFAADFKAQFDTIHVDTHGAALVLNESATPAFDFELMALSYLRTGIRTPGHGSSVGGATTDLPFESLIKLPSQDLSRCLQEAGERVCAALREYQTPGTGASPVSEALENGEDAEADEEEPVEEGPDATETLQGTVREFFDSPHTLGTLRRDWYRAADHRFETDGPSVHFDCEVRAEITASEVCTFTVDFTGHRWGDSSVFQLPSLTIWASAELEADARWTISRYTIGHTPQEDHEQEDVPLTQDALIFQTQDVGNLGAYPEVLEW